MLTSPLTLEALIVIDTIDRRGSFAAAAEQLNKVPSALSYIVQKLEEQLAVTLFVRQGRRSVLTPAGIHLLAEGRKLLGAASQLAAQTQTIAHGWEPKINIAYDSILDSGEFLSCLASFLEQHQNIEIDLQEQVMNGTWEALMSDRVDLVIGAPAPIPSHHGIRAVKLLEIDNIFVVSAHHPLAHSKQPVSKGEIAQCRTVIVHDSAQKEVPWSSNFIEQSQHFFVNTVEQKISAITAGIGVGFLPRNRISQALKIGDLVEIDTKEHQGKGELYLAWKIANKGKGLQQLTKQLLQHYQQLLQ